MLFVLMHKKIEYLNNLSCIVRENGISNSRIIKKKEMGLFLTGGDSNFFFHKGSVDDEYDKAFVCVLPEKKIDTLLFVIENDPSLNYLNQKQEGFICILPFNEITHLKN